jgi:hypothetical protein
MMMMKKRRKSPLLEKGSSHLLRLHKKVKGDPLQMRTRLRKPRRRRNKSLKLKRSPRRIKEKRMKEERKRRMKRKDLWSL